MLNNKEFDLWADGYDRTVQLSEENNEYPFAGYKDVLNTIYNIVHSKEKVKILDIGFGTGILTKKLYNDGYEIYGIDFSERMIEIAKRKMPLAKLFQYDFSKGLPKELENIKFDYIISTYAMHHLEDKDKIKFVNELDKHLSNNGEIIIGDVAFETRELLEQCKIRSGDYWDDEEIYIVFDELKESFPKNNIDFISISHCAGIIQYKRLL
ncbi:class I SAM-dependent methyltransferase [Clostridium algidicarnis]|uniref:class I SAM-dependent methyltransferase n=1 Tax=Clostridium algidicarnis TaxID=37659 RepID=UPI001C0D78C3|nr:class I SAM-dependent methyltransferase [Clostridium algidicarnis]MBU3204888.1 class I SAM-dependent methyltransferase [Clostridium algidicarnis]MBU3213042.1 class I SAM-dependent methyltransferase [Clostridium algidicarnis]MBU3223698.1 class I SAM-dependent methyltransferase [Clostridium algidicarnis]